MHFAIEHASIRDVMLTLSAIESAFGSVTCRQLRKSPAITGMSRAFVLALAFSGHPMRWRDGIDVEVGLVNQP